MGVIKQGILGGFSGKVANIIGGSWKGIAYMRSRPLSVANPNTAGQQAQRGAFTQIVIVAKILLAAILKPLNDRFAQHMSGYNRFVQMSIDAFSTGGLSTPADMLISEGSLTAVPSTTSTGADASNRITIEWTDNSGTGTAVATDEAYGVAYNEDTDEWSFTTTPAQRDSEQARCDAASNGSTGETVHGWLAFRRSDGTLASNTVYSTSVIA